MGFLDKAKNLVSGNKDKIRQGIDQAEQQAAKYAGGKHGAKVAKAADMARKGVDKVPAADPVAAPDPADDGSPDRNGTGDTPDGDGGE